MAVSRHAVNRSQAGPDDKVVVFGARPIGLGAAIWLKLRGVSHVTVVDIDAAGAPAVFTTVVAAARWKAKTVMVAVQKKSGAIDLAGRLRSELTLIASQGCPTEIFEVVPELAEHQDRFARLISHRIPAADIERAVKPALAPGEAEKIVVTFDDRD